MATAEQERIIRKAFAGQNLPATLTPGQIDLFVERYPELFGASSTVNAEVQAEIDRALDLLGGSAGAIEGEDPNYVFDRLAEQQEADVRAEQERIIRKAFAGQNLPATLTPGQIDLFVERYPELFGASSTVNAEVQAEIDRALDLLGDSAGAIEGEDPNYVFDRLAEQQEADVRAALEEAGGDMATDQLGEGPYTRYLRARGVGAGAYRTPGERYIASQYEPLRSLYETQQPVYAALGRQTLPWDQYQAQFPDVASRRARAREVLGGLTGMTAPQRGEAGLTFERAFDEYGEPSYEGANLGYLQNLITAGLAGTRGGRGAGWLASRVPFLQEQWEMGNRAAPFIDYLKSKFGGF